MHAPYVQWALSRRVLRSVKSPRFYQHSGGRRRALFVIAAAVLGSACTTGVSVVGSVWSRDDDTKSFEQVDATSCFRWSSAFRDTTWFYRSVAGRDWSSLSARQAELLVESVDPQPVRGRSHIQLAPSGESLRIHRSGWPLRSFIGWRYEPPLPPRSRHYLIVVGEDPERYRFIPIAPLPLGFLLDTLLFGSVPIVLWCFGRIAQRTLRRLRRRCPNCAYPLLQDRSRCPECGFES